MADRITWADIDALSPDAYDGSMAANFREAGFDEQESIQGAKLMESGRYFGFVDVATSLLDGDAMTKGRSARAQLLESRINKVGRRVDAESLQGMTGEGTTRGARGRLVRSDGSEITLEVLESKFHEVGLSREDAKIAARGMRDGTYTSFVAAVEARWMWGSGPRGRVSKQMLVEVASTLPGGGVVES